LELIDGVKELSTYAFLTAGEVCSQLQGLPAVQKRIALARQNGTPVQIVISKASDNKGGVRAGTNQGRTPVIEEWRKLKESKLQSGKGASVEQGLTSFLLLKAKRELENERNNVKQLQEQITGLEHTLVRLSRSAQSGASDEVLAC
jgi:hypothetical protein